MLLILDRQHRILVSNKFTQKWVKRTAEEIRGKHRYKLIHNREETVNEKRVKLSQVVYHERSKFACEYDFGDDWMHEILVEKILQPEPGKRYPLCLAGRRSAPPLVLEIRFRKWMPGSTPGIPGIRAPIDPDIKEAAPIVIGEFPPMSS